MKTLLGKKINEFGQIRFKNDASYIAFCKKLENSTHINLSNFRGQYFNWAWFCEGEKIKVSKAGNSCALFVRFFE